MHEKSGSKDVRPINVKNELRATGPSSPYDARVA